MRNLAIAIIEHGQIKTTEVKAKQLRQYVERLITIAKAGVAANDDAGVGLAKRRLAFSYLNDKEAVKKLFAEVAPASAQRPGGYTRVVKAGPRAGDGAPMAYIEFVDRQVGAAPEAPAAEEAPKKPRRRTKKATEETATA
jgi:large subunit ribosomal protein L17